MSNRNGNPSIRQRMFLVGCPRSGTTLLQTMLMSHSDIHSFPETHFFERAFAGRRAWFMRHFAGKQFSEALLNPIRRDLGGSTSSLEARDFRSGVAAFGALLDAATLRAGKSRWLEKTPGHLRTIPFILRYFPDARFIHLLRDGRAVAASLYDVSRAYPAAWGGPRSIERCVAEWNEAVSEAARWVGSDAHLFVAYEDLVSHPAEELARLAAGIGVGFEPEMTSGFMARAPEVVGSAEGWKARNSSGLADKRLAKFYEVLKPEEREYANMNLKMEAYDWLRRRGRER